MREENSDGEGILKGIFGGGRFQRHFFSRNRSQREVDLGLKRFSLKKQLAFYLPLWYNTDRCQRRSARLSSSPMGVLVFTLPFGIGIHMILCRSNFFAEEDFVDGF